MHPSADAIRIRCAAVLVREDEILLVKHRKNGNEYWLLPGGGLERGETVTQATERELLEECGVNNERLVAVAWVNRSTLPTLTLYPDFCGELLRHWQSDFSLNAESLGNLWKD